MKTRLIVATFASTLLSSIVAADNLRVNIGLPVGGVAYFSSDMVIRDSNVLPHRHGHRRYYADNNDRPYDLYRGKFAYASPVVVYQRPDPIPELHILCAPTVAKVCSGSICVFCN